MALRVVQLTGMAAEERDQNIVQVQFEAQEVPVPTKSSYELKHWGGPYWLYI